MFLPKRKREVFLLYFEVKLFDIIFDFAIFDLFSFKFCRFFFCSKMFNVHLLCVIVSAKEEKNFKIGNIIIDLPDIKQFGVLYAIQTDFPNITVLRSDMRRNLINNTRRSAHCTQMNHSDPLCLFFLYSKYFY